MTDPITDTSPDPTDLAPSRAALVALPLGMVLWAPLVAVWWWG